MGIANDVHSSDAHPRAGAPVERRDDCAPDSQVEPRNDGAAESALGDHARNDAIAGTWTQRNSRTEPTAKGQPTSGHHPGAKP